MERAAAAGDDGEGGPAPGPEERYSMDQWSGYDAGRTRLLEFFAARRPSNPIVLTGDIHTNWVNDLEGELPRRERAGRGHGVRRHVDLVRRRRPRPAARMKDVLAENPFVKFYNEQRGYVSCSVTPQAWQADYQVVDTSPEGCAARTRASFGVTDGRPGAERL